MSLSSISWRLLRTSGVRRDSFSDRYPAYLLSFEEHIYITEPFVSFVLQPFKQELHPLRFSPCYQFELVDRNAHEWSGIAPIPPFTPDKALVKDKEKSFQVLFITFFSVVDLYRELIPTLWHCFMHYNREMNN